MILVLNSGSSSLKYRVFGPDGGQRGLVERIGEPGGVADHGAALRRVLDEVDRDAITAVGHRVVHGGSRFREPVVVDADVVATVRELVPLAPLHNVGGLAGIEAAREALPDVPQVAVFD